MKAPRLLFLCAALFLVLATSAAAQTNAARTNVLRKVTIPGYYGLGFIHGTDAKVSDEEAADVVRSLYGEWKLPLVQVAWFGPAARDGRTEPSLLLVGEVGATQGIRLIRPRNAKDAAWLKSALAYPTTPAQLCAAFADNSILADDNFREQSVVFEGVAEEVARGAFNRPYVFFPAANGSDTGLTCYFEPSDANLRKIRKGSRVIVRGDVKQYVMHDVILEHCSVLGILP